MLDLSATFLGFTKDAAALAQVLEEDLYRLLIRSEAAHGRMGQDDDMDLEQDIVWGSIWTAAELSQKRAE